MNGPGRHSPSTRRPSARHRGRSAAPAILIACLLAAALPLTAQTGDGGSSDTDSGESKWSPPPGAWIRDDGWFAPPEPAAPELPETVERAFVIPIQGPIGRATYESVRRKYVRVRDAGAELVIFDIDTWGGAGDAMEAIGNLITNQMGDVRSVAYINPKAISAGSIISVACDDIVVAPGAAIGAASPIPGAGGDFSDPIRGKIEAAVRSIVRSWAKQNGHNADLCEATVTMTLRIWLIRNTRTGELRVVNARDWRGKVAGAPAGDGIETLEQRVDRLLEDRRRRDREDADDGDDDRGTLDDATEWDFVETIAEADEPVSLDGDEAVRYGLSNHMFDTLEDLAAHYNVAGEPELIEDNWSERLAAFLTAPPVASFLFFLMILLAYTEINTPGFGVAGGLAIVCMVLVFGGGYVAGLAQWWDIALIVVGIALLALEILVIPGFGIAGISGILLLLVGIAGAIMPAGGAPGIPLPQTELDWTIFRELAIALAISVAAALVAIPVVAHYLPRVPVARGIVIGPTQAATDSPVTEDSPMLQVHVGDQGTVHSMCRPVGKVRIGEDILDAMTEGSIIEAGTRVRVLRREGNRLIVERES